MGEFSVDTELNKLLTVFDLLEELTTFSPFDYADPLLDFVSLSDCAVKMVSVEVKLL